MAIARGRISMDSYYENLHSNGGSSTQSLDESVPDSHQSILSFKTTTLGCNYTSYLNSSMLSFEQGHPLEDYTNFAYALEHRLGSDPNSLEMARGNGAAKSLSTGGDEQFGWFYGETTSENVSHKRPYMGGEVQPSKKHCGNNKKSKNKTVATKDPQSLAAKNRRERISERLKVLQDLVPNGTKVDLVTMLEKAISYVKFLQLQVKVLATDEFWPSQGGKAPDVAQVKEAIDAILSSHVNCTSK